MSIGSGIASGHLVARSPATPHKGPAPPAALAAPLTCTLTLLLDSGMSSAETWLNSGHPSLFLADSVAVSITCGAACTACTAWAQGAASQCRCQPSDPPALRPAIPPHPAICPPLRSL